ncbi:hypothetical protein [Xanthomonas sp. LMG 12461]|uniref:hypothetical protein n=1 Tax=Xanthomonas sp. LMG 12461 TaxID=2014543 RepID=UPI00186ABC20|nr:hypothetical protein [Xanthomonas sp. LMG 12461]
MGSLTDAFLAHCHAQQNVAPNLLLAVHLDRIQSVLEFLDAEPSANKFNVDIKQIFQDSNWLLNPVAFQRFIQLVGEAQFWRMAKERGVDLERIPERSNEKTPDFRLAGVAGLAPCFEVKTLSVVGGEFHLAEMDEISFKSQLSISSQLSDGRLMATAITEVSPHGVINDGKNMTAIIRNLIDKSNNNFKLDQYSAAPTCLVLNLMLIDGYYKGNSSLRPVAFGYPDKWQIRSGAYWNLAFGQPGNLVFGVVEFEGKASIEGQLDREGILCAHAQIQALLIIVHPLGEEPTIYGLAREADTDKWLEELKPLGDAFCKLAGENWNDDGDTCGWRLNGH